MAGEVLLNISKDEKERTMRILNVPETEAPEYRELLKNDNFLKS